MSVGADYAFLPHPPVAALQASGIRWAGRYVSMSAQNDVNGKNLLRPERDALLAAGISIVLFAEEGAQAMLGGFPMGQRMAAHADDVARALDMPGIPVVMAADADFSPAQQPALNACLDGCASVIGRDRTWMYGGYYPVHRALDAGKCAGAFQTFAWSGFTLAAGVSSPTDHRGRALMSAHPEHEETRAAAATALPPNTILVSRIAGRVLPGTFLFDLRAGARQGLGATIGGASVDVDEAVHADFGQWPRPHTAPVPAPRGDDIVTGFYLPDTERVAPIAFDPGEVRRIRFYSADTETIRVDFDPGPGQPDPDTVTLELGYKTGAHGAPVPDGCEAARVVRGDTQDTVTGRFPPVHVYYLKA